MSVPDQLAMQTFVLKEGRLIHEAPEMTQEKSAL